MLIGDVRFKGEGIYTLKPNFLYGPVISLNFKERWNISSVFLFGQFKTKKMRGIFSDDPLIAWYAEDKKEVKKYDCDLLVNYQVHKYIKIFFGPKYQGYDFKDRYFLDMLGGSNTLPLKRNILYNSFGGGLGIGFTIPLVGGLFFIPNISSVALYGIENIKTVASIKKYKTGIIGGNCTASLAYYIAPIRLTISAGYRYQYLYYISNSNPYYSGNRDQFHGVTVSTIFTI